MPACPECGGWSQNGICQYVHDDPIAILKSRLAEAEEKLKLYQDYVEKMAGAFWASKYQDAEAAAQDILIALAKIESTK